MTGQPDEWAGEAAVAAFDPGRFGFERAGNGWVKDFADLGPVAVTTIGWQHAQVRSLLTTEHSELTELDGLELVVELQRVTWGMAPEELVPGNVLAVLAETGGAVIVAYRRGVGFNLDGWLGFAIGFGSPSGRMLSHMLGVREEARGQHDIGWYLKVMQAHVALNQGYRGMDWTFDPMRGANARLNLEKLGGVVRELTIDKYGTLSSALYGDVPSDRFTVHWDIQARATAERVHAVARGDYRGPDLADVAALPAVIPESVAGLVAAGAPRLRYQIPGDVDHLMRDDPATAIAWRQEMRRVLPQLLTTRSARLAPGQESDPLEVGIATIERDYVITGIATGLDDTGRRQSWYLFDRTHPGQGD